MRIGLSYIVRKPVTACQAAGGSMGALLYAVAAESRSGLLLAAECSTLAQWATRATAGILIAAEVAPVRPVRHRIAVLQMRHVT